MAILGKDPLIRDQWVEALRLYSGLFAGLFVVMHLLNHALGIHSLGWLESGAEWLTEPWGDSGLMLGLLIAALAIHALTALWTLFRRRNLRLPLRQAAQITLGLTIPVFMLDHLLVNFGFVPLTDLRTSYPFILTVTWDLAPVEGVKLALGMLLVWIHAVLGVHQWIAHRPWYRRWRIGLLLAAVLLPCLSLAGYVAAGARTAEMALVLGGVNRILANARFSAALEEALMRWSEWSLLAMAASLALLLIGRRLRLWILLRGDAPKLIYRDNNILQVSPGATVLETVQTAGIAHASICGGRARCSVCRVRLGEGGERLPPPGNLEARVLERVGAPDSVRLACQIRPVHDLEVTPQLPPTAQAEDGFRDDGRRHGQERKIVILFADLRGFTTLSEKRLPFDVVFILNRYFKMVGEAVQKSGGYLDKFIGDGVMALFGHDVDLETAARRSLACAKRIAEGLVALNESLTYELEQPLRVGIGLHAGHVIIGEMGFGSARHLTALGDAVNTASRLEGASKTLGVQLVVSETVAGPGGLDINRHPAQQFEVRGRERTLMVHAVPNAAELPD